MINKNDLKDWLDESNRKQHVKRIEEYIDNAIKQNALSGNMTFYISTGRYTPDGSRKTPFYAVWYCKDLSEENTRIVQERVINKYKDFGFSVERTSVDCGWSNSYSALKFKDIDKVLERDETEE